MRGKVLPLVVVSVLNARAVLGQSAIQILNATIRGVSSWKFSEKDTRQFLKSVVCATPPGFHVLSTDASHSFSYVSSTNGECLETVIPASFTSSSGTASIAWDKQNAFLPATYAWPAHTALLQFDATSTSTELAPATGTLVLAARVPGGPDAEPRGAGRPCGVAARRGGADGIPGGAGLGLKPAALSKRLGKPHGTSLINKVGPRTHRNQSAD